MEPTLHTLTVAEEYTGERLDKWLAAALPSLSRTRLKSLISEGQVTLNGKSVAEASQRVKPGERYQVNIPEITPSHLVPKAMALDIVYEDTALLVINKHAGMTVHPGAGNQDDTLVNALLAHCQGSLSGIGGVERPGIVHRLDKDTSGLLVVAKTDAAHHHLAAQLKDRTLSRVYTAFVWKLPSPPSGTLEGNIGRHPQHRLKMTLLQEGGRTATTHYQVTEVYGTGIASRVSCTLETGRTHQIRVHLTHAGYPLIGDTLYGPRQRALPREVPRECADFLKQFPRQALHARKIGFLHPDSNEYMTFKSPLPADLMELQGVLQTL
ncbi:MAG: RluA family pseudouridine synthase [Rickettsiales bacterium]|nr:RluA family pseudouridine synthase [Rickettsiales bacterium]